MQKIHKMVVSDQHQIECTDFRELEILKFDGKEHPKYITLRVCGVSKGGNEEMGKN